MESGVAERNGKSRNRGDGERKMQEEEEEEEGNTAGQKPEQ